MGLKHGIAKGTHVILGDIQSENWPKTLLSFHFLKYMSNTNYKVVSKKNVNLKVYALIDKVYIISHIYIYMQEHLLDKQMQFNK